jgi:hypothetical protein
MKRLTDYLIAQGIDQVSHSQKTYLAHLIGLYRDLEALGCAEDVCRAGMFHSIYGTQLFQGFKLPLERRAAIRALIGERAERLAYLNCAMDRATFDRATRGEAGPHRFRDRLSGEEVELSAADFDDLCRIHLYDWLEQVGRSRNWDYRRDGYRQLAERLGEKARADYNRVFALEAAPATA